MVAVDAAQQEWLPSQDCGSAGLGVGTNRKLKTFPVLHVYTGYGLLLHDFFQANFIPPVYCMISRYFKDALSQVVVEYDEEIPYDQDLAIRYSPFPIHQLCPLVVARRAKGLVPKYDLHAPVDISDEAPTSLCPSTPICSQWKHPTISINFHGCFLQNSQVW